MFFSKGVGVCARALFAVISQPTHSVPLADGENGENVAKPPHGKEAESKPTIPRTSRKRRGWKSTTQRSSVNAGEIPAVPRMARSPYGK